MKLNYSMNNGDFVAGDDDNDLIEDFIYRENRGTYKGMKTQVR